jgi:hypothetical protein
MTLYRIKDWAKHYEVSDSKKVDGPLSWVAVRTKQDGFGFRRMAQERDRCELLAAWVLMVEIAARQRREERGKLIRDGRPLTARSLATMTGFPEGVFTRALEFFSEQEQDWLFTEELPDQSAPPAASARAEGAPGGSPLIPAESESSRTGPDGAGGSGPTPQDRTPQDNGGAAPPSAEASPPPARGAPGELPLGPVDTDPASDPIAMTFPTVGTLAEWPLRQSKVAEYRTTFPGVDVEAALREARQWCVDNTKQRKTAAGMPKFLFGWLERRQNRGGPGQGPAKGASWR